MHRFRAKNKYNIDRSWRNERVPHPATIKGQEGRGVAATAA